MKKNAHSPYLKFKGWLREKCLTYADVAEVIDVSECTVSQKINGKSDFYANEIYKLNLKLGVDIKYFF